MILTIHGSQKTFSKKRMLAEDATLSMACRKIGKDGEGPKTTPHEEQGRNWEEDCVWVSC